MDRAILMDDHLPPPREGVVKSIVLLSLLTAAVNLPGLASHPLADPDEARYALVVQHMLRSGDWIVPHVGGRVYMDKPAPYFWLAAAGQVLTGDVELGGRLVSAGSGLLAVLVTFAFARSVAGNRAGLIAGAILATAPGPLTVARLYRMDMPFVALMWAALWWFWRYEATPERSGRDRRKQWLGFYALCAGATLMKGPAGLGLPGLVVAAYLLLSGRPRRILEVMDPPGIALCLLIAAPWYVAMSLRQPDYAYEFLVFQNLIRYGGRALDDKTFPGVLYLPIVLGCMMPWTIYLPGALARTFPRRWRERAKDPVMLFGWLAAIVPLVFFMLGRTKLATYVLPVAPPLAAMIAFPIARWTTSHHPDRLFRVGTVALRVALGAMLLALVGFEWHEGWLDAWIVLPAAGVMAAVSAMTFALRHARRAAYLAWATAGVVGMLVFAAVHTAGFLCAHRSTAPLGRIAAAHAGEDACVCYLGKRRHSFALYAGRVEAKRFDRDAEADYEALARLVRSERRVLCLVQGMSALHRLEAKVARPLSVLGSHDNYVLVTNEPSGGGGGAPTQPAEGRL